MAKLYNLARVSTATTGTGTITLGSAVSGYLTFALAGVVDGDIVGYGIKDGANSEVGSGTYTASGTTLTRTVTTSTNSNAAISLSGTAEVYITARAQDLVAVTDTTWLPRADGVISIGSSSLGFSELFLVNNASITWNPDDASITVGDSDPAVRINAVSLPSGGGTSIAFQKDRDATNARRFEFGDLGGFNTDTTGPFWRGLHYCGPTVNYAGSDRFPRMSTYFEYDVFTNPTFKHVVWEIGNANGSDHRFQFKNDGGIVMIDIGVDGSFITGSGANALAVGVAGTTDPVLKVDASTASVKTGVQIKGAAVAGRVAVSVISSGTDEGLDIDAKGAGTIRLGNTSTGLVDFKRTAQMAVGGAALSPLTFQSGTNLTTAAVGACEFDGKAFYQTSVASARQVVNTEQIQVLSATRTFTSNTSAQAIFNATTNGAITLAASTSYEFEMVVAATGFSSSAHTINLTFATSGSFTSVGYYFNAQTGSTLATPTNGQSGFIAVGTASAIIASSTTTGLTLYVRGTIRMNTGGTVTPQFTQVTNSAAAVVQINSFIRFWPIGINTVTNVGNWS